MLAGCLEDAKVRVLVVGGPKQGKSALIEALWCSRRDVAGDAPSEISRLMMVEPNPPAGRVSSPSALVESGTRRRRMRCCSSRML